MNAFGSVTNGFDALPDELKSKTRWLLWKQFPGERPGKTRKTPFYANGKVRKGMLDVASDLAQLVTFQEAHDAYLLGDYAGIGFAVTGDAIGAFDLDHILDENGKVDPAHSGALLVEAAERLGAYIEISPSGRGLRIIGKCANANAYSKHGTEFWGQKRFLTITGRVRANPKGWANLDELRSSLGPDKSPVEPDTDDDGPIITPKTIAELRDALNAIDADERQSWIDIGHALKTIPGEKGKDLWLEWSATSPKFERADALATWETFNPTSTGYGAVFAAAQRCGWINPRKGADCPERKGRQPIDLGEDKLHPTEFVLDGFLPVGVSVVAGAWGAGKSTNLIPLMASVAHLAPEPWTFWPDLRRHIIWITEAPEQARDTLWSLSKADGSADWQEFKDWFHLYPSRRDPASDLADELKGMVEDLTYETASGFEVKPVVVLDTTTANLDLENENDNAQVGAALASLKQALRGTPIVLIGHTPKAMVRSADPDDMTFRGAGAWEAEAAATYVLGWDQDADTRFLAIRKARFTPTYGVIEFGSDGGSLNLETPWGTPQYKFYLHGVPRKSSHEARRAARREAAEERKEAAKAQGELERQEAVMAAIRRFAASGQLATRNALHEALGGDKTLNLAAIRSLVEGDLVSEHQLSKDDLSSMGIEHKGARPALLLPPEVDFEIFRRTVKENQ